ncbi:MAG TPA: hypothetical protein VK171_09705 [Fimbriimonas sp.]|nr:hypothetical protein [Fimbriimonas sp.]
MIKRYAIAVGLLAALVGCGGAGDTGRLPSLYQGSWAGNWNSSDAADGGAISFTVSADGSFSGTIATKSTSGSVSGHIDKYGALTGVSSFAGGGNMIMGGAVTMSSGRISSNFNYVVSGIQYGGSFDCGAGAAGGGSTTGGG